jgi:hypothetical protein
MANRKMDKKSQHYREEAAKRRRLADSTSDDTARKNLLSNVAEFEQMAVALDTIAPADRLHPKHPSM